jgi:hypothetical protein
MRRLLTAALATTLALIGTLSWAAPASAADSLGWDAGMKCFYVGGTKYSIVKVQWAYHVTNGIYVYKPYAVHVLEAPAAYHQTLYHAIMIMEINGENPVNEFDEWYGTTTYTFGPTRLSHITSYASRGQVGLTTVVYSRLAGGVITSCRVTNTPS